MQTYRTHSPKLRFLLVLVLVSYARAHLAKRNKFSSKRTLDYFLKKYPENANDAQMAVRAETVNVTAYRVGCNT